MFDLENVKGRLKSKKLWLGASSLLLLVLQGFGFQIVEADYNSYVTAILGLLGMIGVIDGEVK